MHSEAGSTHRTVQKQENDSPQEDEVKADQSGKERVGLHLQAIFRNANQRGVESPALVALITM